ncbi:MAG: hypothetical protein L6Q37_17435, partial [Bdellovibrionaceae bacterium]|nr:hypothetical protein [Pseudobdellovibrionaceae bacterium]
MKKWFLVSIAVFGFLVACGKKDKKQGTSGLKASNNGAQLDCKVKDKDSAKCKPEATTPAAKPESTQVTPIQASGVDTTSATLNHLPNLSAFDTMSLHLEKNMTIVGQFSLRSLEADSDFIGARISCRNLSDNNAELIVVNPEDITSIMAEINLFDNSQILTLTKATKEAQGIKPMLVSCKSDSQISPTSYATNPAVQVIELKEGMTRMDVIGYKDKLDDGFEVTFECSTETEILKNEKKILSENYMMNKVKILKGS